MFIFDLIFLNFMARSIINCPHHNLAHTHPNPQKLSLCQIFMKPDTIIQISDYYVLKFVMLRYLGIPKVIKIGKNGQKPGK